MMLHLKPKDSLEAEFPLLWEHLSFILFLTFNGLDEAHPYFWSIIYSTQKFTSLNVDPLPKQLHSSI